MLKIVTRVASVPLVGLHLKTVLEAVQRRRAVRMRQKAQAKTRRLCASSEGTTRAVIIAIGDALANTVSPDERSMLDRLESSRNQLDSCETELLAIDYGAGDGDLHLSAEEMAAGRKAIMTVGDVYRTASQPPFWSLLLFKLVRQTKPLLCLELGTAIGISASYTASALKLNSLGHLVTLEGSESIGSVARDNFRRLGLDNVSVVIGRFEDSLPEILNRYQPIDFVFVDGHHDEKATLAYFRQIEPFLAKQAVLVFDDVSWSDGMKRAWAAIENDLKVTISLDLTRWGVCVFDSSVSVKRRLRIPLA